MTVVKVSNLEDLIEIFPSLNLCELVDFYEDIQTHKFTLIDRIKKSNCKNELSSLSKQLVNCLSIDIFLKDYFSDGLRLNKQHMQ